MKKQFEYQVNQVGSICYLNLYYRNDTGTHHTIYSIPESELEIRETEIKNDFINNGYELLGAHYELCDI